ncbi:MAG TPA: CoA-binding protein [Candidatus Diapherotrites archaeon]|uniref:CoA-binding protein n=1 Tax=Candidatus Iainarchaeum sp. TaxID=3101447 RepID=A0A7J4IVZ9_9ARCH|nr:CoA-binding protein [Candidatus Diapherotrites archaeon]
MKASKTVESIAILGASANRTKFGNKCVRAYKKLGWKVFPVNPKEKEIEGLKCYASLRDLPERPFRVSIYLPHEITLGLVKAIADSGAREVILNPGAESRELVLALESKGIRPVLACSIRMEGLSPDEFRA